MHSILLHTDLKDLEKQFNAKVDTEAFRQLFTQRLKEKSIKICKALEHPFVSLKPFDELRDLVVEYHSAQEKLEKAELKKQEKRLADALKKLEKKQTKTLILEKNRAEKKVKNLERKIKAHGSLEPKPWEGRIFPLYHAPLIVGNTIRPFRFLIRPQKRDVSFDRKFLYKAKLESLSPKYFERIHNATGGEGSVWRPLFGKQHGVLVFKRFYENVSITVDKSSVLGFELDHDALWLAPCLWDRWTKGKQTLHSFAIITQPAPEKIQKQGYHRCPVSLSLENAQRWLFPEGKSDEELYSLLEESALRNYKSVA